jgi:hypothetical protein
MQNALRILMLNYRLDLPLKRYIHPIFVACAGLVSTLVAIFKIWEKFTDSYSEQSFGSKTLQMTVGDMRKKLLFQ